MRGTVLIAGLLLLAPDPAQASGDLDEVKECVEANLPGHSSIETIRLVKTDRTGSKRTLHAKHYWKLDKKGRSKNLIEIEAPPDLRGSSYLVIQKKDREDVFSYLPEIGHARRLQARTMSGSVFGTDFSYEDLRYLQATVSRSNTQRLDDSELDGRAVFLLESNPAPEEESEYERVVSWIDHDTCVPLKIEYYAASDVLRKVLLTDPSSIERTGKGWVAKSATIRNLKNETQTSLLVEEVEIDPEIKERMFTVTYLEKSH